MDAPHDGLRVDQPHYHASRRTIVWTAQHAAPAEGLREAASRIAALTEDDVRDYEQGLCFFCGGASVPIPGPRGGVKGERRRKRVHEPECSYIALRASPRRMTDDCAADRTPHHPPHPAEGLAMPTTVLLLQGHRPIRSVRDGIRCWLDNDRPCREVTLQPAAPAEGLNPKDRQMSPNFGGTAEGLDVDRLERALRTDTVRRYVSEAWVESGVSEAGYATVGEMAAAIAREYAALARRMTMLSDPLAYKGCPTATYASRAKSIEMRTRHEAVTEPAYLTQHAAPAEGITRLTARIVGVHELHLPRPKRPLPRSGDTGPTTQPAAPAEGLREAAKAALELLTDLSVAYHQAGSIRDHADPNDKTGWNVHGIETCGDLYCTVGLGGHRIPSRRPRQDGGPVVMHRCSYCGRRIWPWTWRFGWHVDLDGTAHYWHSRCRR